MGDSEVEQTLFRKPKTKKFPKVRLALNDADEDWEEQSEVIFRPKKNSAVRGQTVIRAPSSTKVNSSLYSSDYLNELRQSTPTIPKDYPADFADANELDAIVEDSSDHLVSVPAHIPDQGTIRHLKEQREVRRRAGENYIPLSEALSERTRDAKDFGKRIQSEDVVDQLGGDGTEGLTGYESDSLPLGETNLEQAARQKRAGIQAQIEDRLGTADQEEIDSSSANSSDSDDEWERTQTRKTGAVPASTAVRTERTEPIPPVITPIPSVQETLAKLKQRSERAERLVESKRLAIAQIEQERMEIAEQEEAIKIGLQKATLAFETAQLRIGGLETIAHQT